MTIRMAVNTKGGGLDDTPEVSQTLSGVKYADDSSTGPNLNLKVSFFGQIEHQS